MQNCDLAFEIVHPALSKLANTLFIQMIYSKIYLRISEITFSLL
jgi:hypothetical protein